MIVFRIFFLYIILSATIVSANWQNTKIRVVDVVHYDFFNEFIAIGKCRAEKSRDFYAKKNGVVDYITQKQDQIVNSNEIIIAMDSDVVKAEKEKAISAFELNKLNHESNLSLLKQRVVSDRFVRESKLDLDKSKADVVFATETYDDMIIHAPYDGYIGVIKAKIGDNIEKGEYLFTIIGEGGYLVFVELPESMNQVINQDSEIFIIDNSGNKIYGKIIAMSDYLNNQGTITTKIYFDKNSNLTHGSFLKIHFLFDKHQSIAVPEHVVMKNNNGNFIYKVTTENKTKRIYVDLINRANDMVEIKSDEISLGDRVVLEGLTKINDDANVQIIDK